MVRTFVLPCVHILYFAYAICTVRATTSSWVFIWVTRISSSSKMRSTSFNVPSRCRHFRAMLPRNCPTHKPEMYWRSSLQYFKTGSKGVCTCLGAQKSTTEVRCGDEKEESTTASSTLCKTAGMRPLDRIWVHQPKSKWHYRREWTEPRAIPHQCKLGGRVDWRKST